MKVTVEPAPLGSAPFRDGSLWWDPNSSTPRVYRLTRVKLGWIIVSLGADRLGGHWANYVTAAEAIGARKPFHGRVILEQ